MMTMIVVNGNESLSVVGKVKTIIGARFGHLRMSSGVPFPLGASVAGRGATGEDRFFWVV